MTAPHITPGGYDMWRLNCVVDDIEKLAAAGSGAVDAADLEEVIDRLDAIVIRLRRQQERG